MYKEKKKCSENSEATVGLDVEIQIAKIAKDRFPRAPLHANADISLYSTEKPKAKGLRRKRTLPQEGIMIDMK